jgi:hypothetical protein
MRMFGEHVSAGRPTSNQGQVVKSRIHFVVRLHVIVCRVAPRSSEEDASEVRAGVEVTDCLRDRGRRHERTSATSNDVQFDRSKYLGLESSPHRRIAASLHSAAGTRDPHEVAPLPTSNMPPSKCFARPQGLWGQQAQASSADNSPRCAGPYERSSPACASAIEQKSRYGEHMS